MEPKFQSSFIPKGTVSSSSSIAPVAARREKSLMGFIAKLIFTVSVLLALGVFAYQLYLNYSIKSMTVSLESARAALDPETINELTSLNKRIVSTEELIASHSTLSPLFDFLEDSTLKAVRFSTFNYAMTQKGLELSLRGEARGYSALALQAEAFNKSEYLDKPAFSDLNLDDKGNVVFSVKAMVNPVPLSYRRQTERLGVPTTNNLQPTTVATTTATTTPR
ncbi:MAG: hypothetical protein Q7R67_01970 [bacterium]|nr:hypothetical protein [bacterium]